MDNFSVECPQCGTNAAISVPAHVEVHPFPCPGCGLNLDPETGHTGPMPQHDTSKSPAPQAKIFKFRKAKN